MITALLESALPALPALAVLALAAALAWQGTGKDKRR
jgi:hypothetical protein